MLIKFTECIIGTTLKNGDEVLGNTITRTEAWVNPEIVDSVRLTDGFTEFTGTTDKPDLFQFGNIYELTDAHGVKYLVDTLAESNATLCEVLGINE